MNKTKTIYFLSAIVLIIGCYALNLSYSLFVQTESKNIVNATVPVLSYNLEQSEFPILANSSEVLTLKINNTGTTDINFGISTTSHEGVTVQLVEKVDNNIIGTVASSSSKEVLVYVTNTNDTETYITFDLTATYSTVTIAEDFMTTSNIDTLNTIKLLSDTVIANAKSTELTYENKTVYSDTLLTTPAEEISGENERLLLETEDDYTVETGQNSYYFRGNVIDNYVTFAKMCWRIVRIKGNGSIKLILEDKDNTCEEMAAMTSTIDSYNPYKGNFDIASKVYGYNTSNYTADYLGYTSGMADMFLVYQTTLAQKIDSNIGDTPTTEQVRSTLASKLEVGDWCNTEGIKYDSDYQTILTQEQINNKITNNGQFYYDSYVRLNGRTPKEPTLKCNGTTISKFRDNTDMYVGTLTADEIAYAGGGSFENRYYYLMNDYVNFGRTKNIYISWWSLSPYYFFGSSGYSFQVNYNGQLDGNFVYSGFALRPSVSLKSNTTIVLSGEGTMSNPYIIG